MSERRNLIRREGALYALLDKHFPNERSKQGHLDIPRMAADIGVSNEGIYKPLRKDQIMPQLAHKLLRLHHERYRRPTLYYEDFMPFMCPEWNRYSDPLR